MAEQVEEDHRPSAVEVALGAVDEQVKVLRRNWTDYCRSRREAELVVVAVVQVVVVQVECQLVAR